MIIRILKLSLFLLFSFSTLTINAKTNEVLTSNWEVKNQIENEVKALLDSFDPQAKVIVHVIPVKTQFVLESTPFVYLTNQINQATGLPQLKSILVKVYSQKKQLPDELIQLIKGLGESYQAELKLNYFKVPDFSKGNVKNVSDSLLLNNKELISVGIASLFFLLFVIGFVLRSKSMTGVENTIKDSLSQMVQKLSESPLAMSQNMSNMPTSQPTDTPIVRAKDENEVIDQLSSESLVALLSDCYWCELDTYAAYIWLKLSVNTKKEVLGLWEFMSEYVNYISQLEPTIQSYHKDPYYLTPLDFKNYNNNQIRELISKNKTLFLNISKMRRDHLNFPINEKIDLFGQELTPFKGNIKQMQFKPYRKINSFSGLKVNSVEDEVGLMSIKDPSFKLINSIKSIVWAIHLSDEEIKNILNNFTAPDLAQAWLGPEEFLDKLKSQLPDKKLKLLTSYLQNTKASRESRAYKEIYKLTCQAFANSAREEINEGEANESAA